MDVLELLILRYVLNSVRGLILLVSTVVPYGLLYSVLGEQFPGVCHRGVAHKFLVQHDALPTLCTMITLHFPGLNYRILCRAIALWDYYATSASANDSFVAGVGGGGYVFLNTLSSPQFKRYTQRVGRLLNNYGPRVVDTYGFADPDLLANYSAEAALGGVAPSAYISEPTHFGIWDEIPGKPILP